MPNHKKFTPRKIVEELDKYIVGQEQAKRTVAVALRWRWRRMRTEESLRDEITPKNILMIGPTGVGKTEVSRRLARFANAPFIKVEATKFTEVGYVGRDVDSIVRDLLEVAMDDVREELSEQVKDRAEERAEERLLDALLPGGGASDETREKLRRQLRAGELDDKEVEIEVSAAPQVEVLSPPGMEEITSYFQNFIQNMGKERRRKRTLRVIDAFHQCADEETHNLVDANEIKDIAIDRTENNGIVFIDEIDKIAENNVPGGATDVSRHGVQRDLLPLVEGTTVSTRHGNVHTDHILFIASGAFHYSRPSDLIPELQGRFPLRVELSPLTVEDFKHILTSTRACLTKQYQALMKTERVYLTFTDDSIDEIAKIAWRVNETNENIGARRLYTVMEKLLEGYSYDADKLRGEKISIDAETVRKLLSPLSEDADRARYIL